MTDQSQATWRKASLSSYHNGCVEVAGLPEGVALRDSQTPEAGTLVVSRPAFGVGLSGLMPTKLAAIATVHLGTRVSHTKKPPTGRSKDQPA